MHPFAVLADPVRRRLVEVLATGEHAAGQLVELVGTEFGITQSAVSQQLQVLREQGFASVRAEGRRRMYAIQTQPLEAISAWVAHYSAFWDGALESLAEEIERGKTQRHEQGREEPN